MINFFKRLFGITSNDTSYSYDELVNANVCPNCWGKQEYQNQFNDYIRDHTKSNINKEGANKKAFINQFVETNITGIRLKSEGDHLSCPSCQNHFKTISGKAN